MKAERVAREWSQNDVAVNLVLHGVDVDSTAIMRMEAETRRIRFNEAVGLCTVLGIDIDEVIAEHPGDLAEQVERADRGVNNALAAQQFWGDELQLRRRRFEELQQQYREWHAANVRRAVRMQELIAEHGFEEGVARAEEDPDG